MPDRFIPEWHITDQRQGIVSVSGSRLPTDDAFSAFAGGWTEFPPPLRGFPFTGTYRYNGRCWQVTE